MDPAYSTAPADWVKKVREVSFQTNQEKHREMGGEERWLQ